MRWWGYRWLQMGQGSSRLGDRGRDPAQEAACSSIRVLQVSLGYSDRSHWELTPGTFHHIAGSRQCWEAGSSPHTTSLSASSLFWRRRPGPSAWLRWPDSGVSGVSPCYPPGDLCSAPDPPALHFSSVSDAEVEYVEDIDDVENVEDVEYVEYADGCDGDSVAWSS